MSYGHTALCLRSPVCFLQIFEHLFYIIPNNRLNFSHRNLQSYWQLSQIYHIHDTDGKFLILFNDVSLSKKISYMDNPSLPKKLSIIFPNYQQLLDDLKAKRAYW